MIVIDLNGKEREVSSIKKINHDVMDVITKEMVSEIFVEVEIIGHMREWTEWWPFNDFKELNPSRRPRWK